MRNYNQAFINRGDAEYVQIIHADPLIFGTSIDCGDIDIYVKDMPVKFYEKHVYAPILHIATSIKKVIAIAEKNGSGDLFPIPRTSILKYKVAVDDDEILVGVYSEVTDSKRGQRFYISLKNHLETLKKSIAHILKF